MHVTTVCSDPFMLLRPGSCFRFAPRFLNLHFPKIGKCQKLENPQALCTILLYSIS
jgi:hypothetical protein